MDPVKNCIASACPSANVIGDKMIIVGKKTQPPKGVKVADDEAAVEVPLEIIKKALKN